MDRLKLPSYAKINLGLWIRDKRTDGYHEIETLLHQISLQDEVEIQLQNGSDGIRFTTDSTLIPEEKQNLCVKAATLLRENCDSSCGVHIHLKKQIPVGAGLGGGSSNAAVVLLGLNKLWHADLGIRELQEIAAQLGSDVPFFIEGGSAYASGRGEVLTPLHLENPLHILVVYPGIEISTAWAYNQVNLDLTRTAKSVKLAYFNNLDFSQDEGLSSLINQFESFIQPSYPLVQEIQQEMHKTRAVYTSLSGSGSAVFGMFRHLEDARQSMQVLEEAYQCFLTNHIHWGYGQV